MKRDVSAEKMISMHNEALLILKNNNLSIVDAMELLTSLLYDVMSRGKISANDAKSTFDSMSEGYSVFLQTMKRC